MIDHKLLLLSQVCTWSFLHVIKSLQISGSNNCRDYKTNRNLKKNLLPGFHFGCQATSVLQTELVHVFSGLETWYSHRLTLNIMKNIFSWQRNVQFLWQKEKVKTRLRVQGKGHLLRKQTQIAIRKHEIGSVSVPGMFAEQWHTYPHIPLHALLAELVIHFSSFLWSVQVQPPCLKQGPDLPLCCGCYSNITPCLCDCAVPKFMVVSDWTNSPYWNWVCSPNHFF